MAFVGNQKISVIERSAPARGSDGRMTAPTETLFELVDATVNPVPGDELSALPEGERNTKQLRVITQYELTEGDEDAGTYASIVVYEGERYEVRSVSKYRRVIPHNAARVARIKP
jgi:hypothetical protein